MGGSTLVGRDAEMALLEAALAEAAEHGSALLVTGAAGIGKTSLLDAATTAARSRGYKVLAVTGLESEADLPYAGLHQLLQPVLPSAGALPGPQKDALLTALADLLVSVAPDLDIQSRRLVLDEALGNPLALLELPRALSLQGTEAREGALRSIPLTGRLERTFSAQAGQLPELTQAALLLIALDKDPTVGDVLGAMRKQTGEEVTVDVLQPAVDEGLISVAGSTVRYRHPLMRSALDQAATAGQRRNAHLAFAEVIADP